MMVYLDAEMVPASLRGSYSGKKFRAVVCESVTIPMDAGLWEGGSRETYRAIRLSDSSCVALSKDNASPWSSERREQKFALESGIVVIKHTQFCGKDMGLTFYVHPNDAVRLLPASPEAMDVTLKTVLEIIRGYKPAYRQQYAREAQITQNQWDAALVGLLAMGFVNKAGAITIAGRNAVPSRY